ncbi:hypothetical protein SCHIN_v1c00290 [Spiroplasma chinense]|uniref:Uncharacterized protein n=1 Tax=Spiroplasma chinense TaxID=216932 RepID=A0A5B9Y4P0_9MOLU|nr:hypothetical protein [Spiroplasma chinense]QEH61227.1 hypothetical protein SCHIN_v1c00290 [Spiroplasma chinense]
MNYYIRIDNGSYQIVDGNTNRVIASFVNEIDAYKFMQSLLASVQPQQPMYPMPSMNPYMPAYFPQQPMMPMMPMMQPQQMMQQPMMSQPMVNQNGPVIPHNGAQMGQTGGLMNQGMSSLGGASLGGQTSTKDSMKKNVSFDDTTMSFDMSAFEEDRLGAIIQVNPPMINNTDDDSLGEAAAYSKRRKMDKKADKKSKKEEGEALVSVENKNIESELKDTSKLLQNETIAQSTNVVNDFDLDNMSSVVESHSPVVNDWAGNTNNTSNSDLGSYGNMLNENLTSLGTTTQTQSTKEQSKTLGENDTITSAYENNLMPENRVTSKKDDGLIDLGPIDEEDDIFSTPRMDAQQDDFEDFTLTNKDKKTLKKIKKAEAANRKKYNKMIR